MGTPQVIVIGAGFGRLGAARELRHHGITASTTSPSSSARPTSAGCGATTPTPAPRATCRRRSTRGRGRSTPPGVEVASCELDEASGRWRVTATDGTAYDADVVVSAVGQLSNPVVPAIPGADSLTGPAFHSAQWRHDVDLDGRRVAVIGTGASAIQFVPGIVDQVGSLTVFQRSAPYVVPKPDQAYQPHHHRAFDRFPALLTGERRFVYWLSERLNSSLAGDSPISRPFLGTMRGLWRLHLRRQVPDPALRAQLVPDYEIGCKRVLFSNDWYPALARDHVDVVTDAVTAIEPSGVRTADGRLHEADVLIWGTGFAATRFLAPMTVTGVGGADLHELWSDGARAHLGVATPGFPNLFFVYGPNTNLGGSSIIGMMEAQAGYIAKVTRRIADGAVRMVEPRSAVAEAYDREMQSRLATSSWSGCSSWYVDGPRITTNWPGRVSEYRRRLAEVDWGELEVSV